MRFEGLSALVLHTRAYRESSALVQFFTRTEGRFSAVYRGMRRRRGPQLQAFSLGRLDAVGGSGLLTVTGYEQQACFALVGDALSAGFYVLELISRAIPERQSEPSTFDAAVDALTQLQAGARLAPTLRVFEQQLLVELGFGIDLLHEADTGVAVSPDENYEWVPGVGLRRARASSQAPIPGTVLQAMARADFDAPLVQRHARLLHRVALEPLLGARPLVSRSLLAPAPMESTDDD